MSELVFAYGSNMCSGRFRAYGVAPEGRGQPAALADYRLRFNKRSTLDGSGKANLERHDGSEVWGVLYSISDAELPILDRGEGGYQRGSLHLQTPEKADVEAWVYLAARPDSDPDLFPYTWYKRFLVEGAQEHSLPKVYIAKLKNIEAIEDTNRQRDAEKRDLACQGFRPD